VVAGLHGALAAGGKRPPGSHGAGLRGNRRRLWRCRYGSAGVRRKTGDRRLDDDVGVPADQNKVLDIVSANQNQLAPRVDRQRVGHGEPGRAFAA
jgi:hypothetical protein